VFTEVLEYDCRLMNAASATGRAMALRDLLTVSDEWLSPQAAVLSPAATMEIAAAVVSREDPYERTIAAGQAAVRILKRGCQAGALNLNQKEKPWLDRIEKELAALPERPQQLMEALEPDYGPLYDRANYDLS
jgi:methanol--5-hydroxybenzimidazolylcobamide Co-methyltransferase